MKRVLITGANSYIGDSTRDYLMLEPDRYSVDVKDTIGWEPNTADFEDYDVVFNVAGIAHIKETDENRHLYYDVNRDLVVKIAKAAKDGGVKQFILLSTMSVYGLTVGHITKSSHTNPVNAYGKSKLEADEYISKLSDEQFRFACLRPPMVYGKGCKGNYQKLRKLAMRCLVFPDYKNQRSMIYIGNLCEFIKCCIEEEKAGIFFPQNGDYVNTSQMVELVAKAHGKKVILTKLFNWIIAASSTKLMKKVFGNLTYENDDMISKYSFEESVLLTEK